MNVCSHFEQKANIEETNLANTKQAAKRARQNIKRRDHNRALRSRMRTHVKRVREAIEAKNYETAKTYLAEAIPVLDSSCSKGLLHKNNAARLKSKLNAQVKALAA